MQWEVLTAQKPIKSNKMIKELNRFLHTEIPATQFMQLKILEFKQKNLLSTAPIQPNINDKNTFFGGSSSSLMIICGWSLIKLLCKQSKVEADIVIVSNQARWNQPLKTDSKIKSELQSDWKPSSILDKLKQKKSTLVSVVSKLYDLDKLLCAEMKAKYFIIPKAGT